jgi:transcription factor SPN1
MNIDTETLRESGLGKIVLFYTKCPRVIPRIARIASTLVDTWTRPILKRSASYFDKVVPVASKEEMEGLRMPAPKLAAILQDLRRKDGRVGEDENDAEGGKARSKTMRVSIPESNAATYTIAPSVSASLVNRERGPQDDALASRRNNREMLKKLQRKTEKGGKV